MAERVEKFALVAAAGASNLTQTHAFLDGIVTHVALYVPAGHAGLTSWQLYYGSTQLVPKTAGATIVADDERFEWDLEAVPTGSQYASRYSNTDVFPHTFHIEVWLDEFTVDPVDEAVEWIAIPYLGS